MFQSCTNCDLYTECVQNGRKEPFCTYCAHDIVRTATEQQKTGAKQQKTGAKQQKTAAKQQKTAAKQQKTDKLWLKTFFEDQLDLCDRCGKLIQGSVEDIWYHSDTCQGLY